jgi:carbonic anhydrase/acetyltransferase-like protein (isoleucine patch superfamily)
MEKAIYLQNENYNWVLYEYKDISDLKEILKKNNISIGYRASIGDRASIRYGASIGDDVSIGNHASIGYRASIGDRASIGYSASIGDDVSIGDDASIGDGASIGYSASIGNRASIGDRASIGYSASIGDDVKLLFNIYIIGSKNPITYVGNRKLSIGCHTKEIDWWLKNYELIGKKEGYTNHQIKEYKNYLEAINTILNNQ